MRTTTKQASARTGSRAARLVAAMGALLLTVGLLVVGAATAASANDKPEEQPPAAAGTNGPTDKPTDKPTEKPTDKPGAPGNNGTVKLQGTELDEGVPQNQPHLPCTFYLEWYNFDSGHGTINSTVQFALQAPTDEAKGVTMEVSGNTAPSFVGNGGQPGAGEGRDHVEQYTLSFTGPAHPQQGYHVKVTVETPFSKGNDVKHKVFWVEPCTTASSSPASPATAESSPATVESSPATVESSPVVDGQSQAVAGTEASRPRPDEKPGAQAPPAGSVLGTQAALPTAVASGRPSAGSTAQIAAFLLVASGLALLAGGGWRGARRTRGGHEV